MGSDNFEMHLDSAADNPRESPDPMMLFAKFSPVPRNSNAQSVMPAIVKLMNRAKRLRGALRNHIFNMAKEYKYGYAAIGAEGGFNTKELNTNRYSTGMMSTNVGPAVTPFDEYVNGKMPNNPTSNKPDIDI